MRRRLLAIPVLLMALAGGAPGIEAAPEGLPDACRRGVEKAVRELAQRGESAAVDEVLAWARAAGATDEETEGWREDAARRLRRARPSKKPPKAAADALRDAAGALAALLPAREGEERAELARLVLRLDDEVEPAYAALGHVKQGDTWIDPALAAAIDRRGRIVEAIRAARRMEVKVETLPSTHPMLRAVYGKDGIQVRSGKVSLHSVEVPQERLERLLRESVRAMAVSRFVREGVLEPADVEHMAVVFGAREPYRKAADHSGPRGALAPASPQDVYGWGRYWDYHSSIQEGTHGEAYDEAWIFLDLYYRHCEAALGGRGQPCLDVGHMNWICLQYLGRRLPTLLYTEESVEKELESQTGGAVPREKREEMLRLAEAGLAGTKAFLRWLVSRGEDPPYAAAMQEQAGLIQHVALLKATVVAEYLQETDAFLPLWQGTHPGKVGAGGDIPAKFVAGLGYPLAQLEKAWRAWLMPDAGGLVQRLVATPADALAADVQTLLEKLDAMRSAAQGAQRVNVFRPLAWDEDLSEGCRLHALYLDENPQQKTKWPDAHEEYPDRDGFTAAGARAGLSSVIAPGVDDFEEAVDAWMGTYFHRLPLLDLGLIRVGGAIAKGTAVLDVASFVGPASQLAIVWPPENASDVPRRFVPELPSPFPGKDQSKWGYPVTVQTRNVDPLPVLELALYEGSPSESSRVPCLLTSCWQPGNPDLVPEGAFCLIPERHLAARTLYTVVVKGLPGEAERSWTFKTGTR